MPTDFVWSAQAGHDLRELYDFLHGKSPNAAQSYVEEVLRGCEPLRDFPESSHA
jgi:plasmid stabilization system protein ParE